MRYLKTFLLIAALAIPCLSAADSRSVPASANWYFYVDLEQMREGGPGKAVYDWLREEVLSEIGEDAGVDLERELDRLTAYSTAPDQGVLIVDGNISQETRDIVMTLIASGGDIDPLKSAGKTYYRFGGTGDGDNEVSYDAGNIAFDIDALTERSFISTDVKNKLIVTASEEHMKELLANDGRINGSDTVDGALLVLTAEKALVKAGMKAGVLHDDDWDSNILRNTEQVAFMIAAAAGKLALEAELVTTEAEMADSLASVARGLISLVSFDGDMDDETRSVLRSAKVKSSGNSVSVSLALDPNLLVTALRD